MMLETYLAALLGVALAQAAPGPNLMAVASAALASGRRSAAFTVLGVCTGMLIWATAIAFGLVALLSLYPTLLTGMKLVGGAYLCFLGAKSLIAAVRGRKQPITARAGAARPLVAWWHGLAVVLTNPKAALMWMAVGTFLFGAGLSPGAVVAFGPLAFVSAALIYGGYAFVFSTGAASRVYERITRLVETCFGLVFGALGGQVILDGIRELRS